MVVIVVHRVPIWKKQLNFSHCGLHSPFRTVKVSQQEETFLISTNLSSSCPMSKVCGIISNRVLLLGSSGQPSTLVFEMGYLHWTLNYEARWPMSSRDLPISVSLASGLHVHSILCRCCDLNSVPHVCMACTLSDDKFLWKFNLRDFRCSDQIWQRYDGKKEKVGLAGWLSGENCCQIGWLESDPQKPERVSSHTLSSDLYMSTPTHAGLTPFKIKILNVKKYDFLKRKQNCIHTAWSSM